MHHSFLHGLIFTLTYQTVNLTVIIVKECFKDMDPQETCGTCDHNISQLFLCDPVCIFFCICADHILDPVIVIIRKFILALCSLCNSVIINQSCKFPYSRIFENIRIYQ